jgi:hypothetical protein
MVIEREHCRLETYIEICFRVRPSALYIEREGKATVAWIGGSFADRPIPARGMLRLTLAWVWGYGGPRGCISRV